MVKVYRGGAEVAEGRGDERKCRVIGDRWKGTGMVKVYRGGAEVAEENAERKGSAE